MMCQFLSQACHQLMWVKTSFCTVFPVLHSALVAFLRIIPIMKVIGSLDTHFPKSWAALSECLNSHVFLHLPIVTQCELSSDHQSRPFSQAAAGEAVTVGGFEWRQSLTRAPPVNTQEVNTSS